MEVNHIGRKCEIGSRPRLIKLIEILKSETDDECGLSIEDIIKALKRELGDEYFIEKRAIKNDIKTLKDCGFDIVDSKGSSKRKLYSLVDQPFEMYELRMLIDAVTSAKFITKEETGKLIRKIQGLTSKNYARKLQNQIYIDKRIKMESSEVRYAIDKLHTAILEQRRVQFQYGNYTIEKKFELRHKGAIYYADPYAMVWNNDFYYLVARDINKEKLVHFRLDRMRKVELTDCNFKKENFDVAAHLKKTFNMFPGEVDTVEIQFNNELISVAIDYFGKEACIRRIDDRYFVLRMKAAINQGLVRWILNWGSDAKVLTPQVLVDRIKEESCKMVELYNIGQGLFYSGKFNMDN